MSSQEQTAIHVHRDDVGARMGMWLFLFTELLLFGGMFFLYSVYRFVNQEQFHIAAKELNTLIGTFNTIILLTSSLTMALAIAAIQRNNKSLSVFFQVLTILLAFGFLVNKYFEWSVKFEHGLAPGTEGFNDLVPGEKLFFILVSVS